MGAFSNLGEFSDSEVIAAAGYSENFIDFAKVIPQIGVGKRLMLCIRTDVAPTDGADTLGIECRVSATNDGTDLNGTPKTVFSPLAGLADIEVVETDARLATAGAWIYRGPLPYGVDLRYGQLYYNNTTSNGQFQISAWLEDRAPSDMDKQVTVSPVGQP